MSGAFTEDPRRGWNVADVAREFEWPLDVARYALVEWMRRGWLVSLGGGWDPGQVRAARDRSLREQDGATS